MAPLRISPVPTVTLTVWDAVRFFLAGMLAGGVVVWLIVWGMR
jgi:hypothetical protein